MSAKRHIVAMGGGGFSAGPGNLLMERFVLGLAGRPRPRACFLAQASGDAQAYVDRFLAAFGALPCEATSLSLFRPHTADLEGFLLSQDVVYVGGGNTRSMLALWREWGLDRILRAAWERGTVLAGLSAGMICWFEEGVTDSVPGVLGPLPCLGFLKGSACPHYDSEPGRRPNYQKLVGEGRMKPGYAADDGVGLHFIGDHLGEVVSERRNVRAWRVESGKGGPVESQLVPVYLGEA